MPKKYARKKKDVVSYGNIYVVGAGTTAVNRAYMYHSIIFSKPMYVFGEYQTEGSCSIAWLDFMEYKEWTITVWEGSSYMSKYRSTDDVATPDLVTTWQLVNNGQNPIPLVTVYEPPS